MSYEYEKTLQPPDRARYHHKLSIIGIQCPYKFPESAWTNNPKEWPMVDLDKIFMYLIRSPGLSTRQAVENYRTMRSEHFQKSRFVLTVRHMKVGINNVTVLATTVQPSYRPNEPPHYPWVAVSRDGDIITGHCNCKGGNSETCTHVGGLLYKMEVTCRMGLTRPETCTDVACAWNNVAWGGVPPDCLANIDFYDADKKAARSTPKRPRIFRPDTPPTEEEKRNLLRVQLSLKQLPIGLSTFNSTAMNFISKQPLPVIQRIPRPMQQLLREGLPLEISDADLAFIEESTRPQAASITWHEQRAGRITSSVIRDILHTNLVDPSRTVMTKICSINTKPLNTEAIKWGNDNEHNAIDAYIAQLRPHHTNFVYKRCGLHIHPQLTMLAASPDGLVSCDCHGEGTVEVKCPFTMRHLDQTQWSGMKANSLNSDGTLEEGHAHELQSQHHMYATGRDYCDYVVWTTKDCVVTRIPRRSDYESDIVPVLRDFWTVQVSNYLFGDHTNTVAAIPDDAEEDKENLDMNIDCQCGKPNYVEDMIACDQCDHWFHLGCAKRKTKPKEGKPWYCKKCPPSKRQKTSK